MGSSFEVLGFIVVEEEDPVKDKMIELTREDMASLVEVSQSLVECLTWTNAAQSLYIIKTRINHRI